MPSQCILIGFISMYTLEVQSAFASASLVYDWHHVQVLPFLVKCLSMLLEVRPAKAGATKLAFMLDRALLKLIKTLQDLQDMHPWCAPSDKNEKWLALFTFISPKNRADVFPLFDILMLLVQFRIYKADLATSLFAFSEQKADA